MFWISNVTSAPLHNKQPSKVFSKAKLVSGVEWILPFEFDKQTLKCSNSKKFYSGLKST